MWVKTPTHSYKPKAIPAKDIAESNANQCCVNRKICESLTFLIVLL